MIRRLTVVLVATAGFALPAMAGGSGTGRAGGLGTAMGHAPSQAQGTLGAVSSGTPGMGFGQAVAPNTYGRSNLPSQVPTHNNSFGGRPF